MHITMKTEACKVINLCFFFVCVNSSHVYTTNVSYKFKQKFEVWWDM